MPSRHDVATWTLADKQLAWKDGIHFVLIVSGVLFALMERVAEGTKTHYTDKNHG